MVRDLEPIFGAFGYSHIQKEGERKQKQSREVERERVNGYIYFCTIFLGVGCSKALWLAFERVDPKLLSVIRLITHQTSFISVERREKKKKKLEREETQESQSPPISSHPVLPFQQKQITKILRIKLNEWSWVEKKLITRGEREGLKRRSKRVWEGE